MSKNFVISVVAQDRVGIIADFSLAIKKIGGNLEDMSQTVMRGYFTMLLLSSFPDGTKKEDLQRELLAIKGLDDAEITVIEYTQNEQAIAFEKERKDLYVLTASGPDAPGLVAAIAEYLRQKDINIVDLTTKTSQGKYIMMVLVKLPQNTDVGKLKVSLQIAMGAFGLKTELRHQDIFRVTNEI